MAYSPDDVQFEGEEQLEPKAHSPLEEKPVTGLAKVLIDKNIAANKKSADFILIGVALLFFLLTISILLFAFWPNNQSTNLDPGMELNS